MSILDILAKYPLVKCLLAKCLDTDFSARPIARPLPPHTHTHLSARPLPPHTHTYQLDSHHTHTPISSFSVNTHSAWGGGDVIALSAVLCFKTAFPNQGSSTQGPTRLQALPYHSVYFSYFPWLLPEYECINIILLFWGFYVYFLEFLDHRLWNVSWTGHYNCTTWSDDSTIPPILIAKSTPGLTNYMPCCLVF